MKKSILKPIAICVSVALVISSVGVTAHALTDKKKEEPDKTQTTTESKKEETGEIAKDETVYVLAGADGAVEKIIVSDWIKNALGSQTINDKSELSEVENVKGDETYTMNGDNMRVWDAQGNDIYYQGDVKKELPVNLSVSYTLDGKNISPTELAGKSGHVVIRFDYQNNRYETVKIDGKEEKIYVPFAMLTGMLLDTEVFTNVDVTNGRLVNDGNHMAVVGIAFPGLAENLAIEREKFEIPDYVEISADVRDFEMTTTMTLATNDLFNQINPEKLDSIDSLTESLDDLTDAMNQLMDGSSQLYDGLCTLLKKSGELIAGIDKLAVGAKNLKSGAGNLDAGAAKLQNGAKSLYTGLHTLSANNDTLNSGAKQVFETLLSTANAQLAATGLSIPTLTIENYAEVLNGVIASLGENSAAAGSLISLKASLDSYNTFYLGLRTYTKGVADATAGAKELKSGTEDLKDGTAKVYVGANQLCNGILKMKKQAPSLTEGITQLRDGSMKLSKGLKEFNEQGIEKLVDAVDGDLGSLVTRVRATVDVSKNYKSFSGLSEDMDGEVKFIYRTQSVKIPY